MDKNNQKEIEQKIEELRGILNHLPVPFTSSEILTLSRKLDSYIVTYYKVLESEE